MDLLPLITALHTLGVSEACAGRVVYMVAEDLNKATKGIPAAPPLLPDDRISQAEAPARASERPVRSVPTKFESRLVKKGAPGREAASREFFAVTVNGHRSTVGLPSTVVAQLIAALGSKTRVNAQVKAWADAAQGKTNAHVRAQADAFLATSTFNAKH